MSLELILGALIGGVTEALAGKAIDATPGTARKIQQTLSLVEQQTTGALAQAVQAAVDDARREMLESYVLSDDPVARDVTALFEKYELFAADVARRLIFQGQPDFARLRQHYLAREPKATSARWQALSGPLEEFFTEIENRLLFDGQVGLMLLGLRSTVALTRIDANTAEVATVLQSLLTLQERSTTAGESSAHALQQLVEQTQPISEIAALLRQLVAAPGGAPLSPQIGPVLSAVARTYLRTLRAECNRLPLADDRRSVNDAARQQADLIAQLINVYVDLRTADALDFVQEFALSFDLACDRLRVPAAERDTLRRRWNAAAQGGRGAKKVDAAGEATGALLDTAGKWEDHPLARAAGDEQRLRHALAPMTALEALQRRRRFALLGVPGSGKSTFVNFLCYVLAGALLDDEAAWRSHLDNRFDAPLFPIRVVLRQWSRTLTTESRPGLDLARAALQSCIPDAADLETLLASERTLVCFDGLDEAPPAEEQGGFDRRRILVASVEAFCVAYPRCAVLVTSRVKPYDNPHYRVAGLPVHHLDQLDAPRIERFIDRWYAELARIHAPCVGGVDAAKDRLHAALKTRPTLRTMAGTPLLLTMLARVNARRGLPESRAELYDECVEQLLWEWEKRKADDGGKFIDLDDLLVEPDKRRVDVERILWQMTYDAHKRSGSQAAALPVRAVEEALARLHPRRNECKAWASRVAELMAERGGLLLDNGAGEFTFPHTSLQEYMTARWLTVQPALVGEAAQLAELDTWREVILLACGYHGWKGDYHLLQSLLTELIAGELVFPADVHRLLVAGAAWKEFDPSRAEGNTGFDLRRRIPAVLTQAMQNAATPARKRLEAGLLAADLGALPDDLDEFVPIPDADFRIGKYPVTNYQFRRFVDDGGYAEKNAARWWSEEGRTFKRKYGWRAPWSFGDRRFDRPTQPVMLSWYEAEAFCTWLNATHAYGDIGAHAQVRLPTRAEWEIAARSHQPAPPQASDYPWRGPFEASRANTNESGLEQTTPVHMYRHGQTADHVWDMAGNVWEWTCDLYRRDSDGDARYWFKGGAYYSDADSVRASAAGRRRAGRRDYYRGCRVVVVPISRS
jgi:hypothetical protein